MDAVRVLLARLEIEPGDLWDVAEIGYGVADGEQSSAWVGPGALAGPGVVGRTGQSTVINTSHSQAVVWPSTPPASAQAVRVTSKKTGGVCPVVDGVVRSGARRG
jgi:hypothetical protein